MVFPAMLGLHFRGIFDQKLKINPEIKPNRALKQS